MRKHAATFHVRPALPKSAAEVGEQEKVMYTHDLVVSLSRLASTKRFPLLVHLLEMAAREARFQASRTR
jgi:hypothetical protein